jgi:hypothetical protein
MIPSHRWSAKVGIVPVLNLWPYRERVAKSHEARGSTGSLKTARLVRGSGVLAESDAAGRGNPPHETHAFRPRPTPGDSCDDLSAHADLSSSPVSP